MARSTSASVSRRRSKTLSSAPGTKKGKRHPGAPPFAAEGTSSSSTSSGPRQWGPKGAKGGIVKRKATTPAAAAGTPAKMSKMAGTEEGDEGGGSTSAFTTTSGLSLPTPSSSGPPDVANIRVAVRVRPENAAESAGNHKHVIEVVDDRMLIFDPNETGDEFFYGGKKQNRRDVAKRANRDHKFAFDVVFGPDSTNEDVFQHTTRDLVDVLFSGYNCSVFVYGATGAGKTHTMLGSLNNPGLTFKTVMELYARMEAVKEETHCEVAVSYVEIYNESIIDLIKKGNPLAIREDGRNGVNIPSLSVHRPVDANSLLQFLQTGNANRTQHPTDANAESSRSHAIFQVYLKQRSRGAGLSADVKVAKLSMIDLAGSERASVTHSRGGARLREGANINKSLLALGNVINALAEGSKYIPYRNSKLTRMLKDSIGGNCRTVMISNISPSSVSFEDTYNTLKYADRAKRIKIKLKKNILSVDFHVGQYAKIVETMKRELDDWKAKAGALEKENTELKEKLVTTKMASPDTNSTSSEDDEEQTKTEQQRGGDLDKTYDFTKPSSDTNGTDPEEIADLKSEVARLKHKLVESEARNADESVVRMAAEEDQKRQQCGFDAETLSLIAKHKKLVEKSKEAIAATQRLSLKKEFANNILERSALVAVSAANGAAAGNEKIAHYVEMLNRKIKKSEKKEKRCNMALAVGEKTLCDKLKALEVENPQDLRARLVKAELSAHEQSCMMQELLNMFIMAYDEQSKTEDIIKMCLPQVKSKHLLLSSFGNFEEENEQYKNLVSCVQCTNVRFKDSRLVDTDDDTSADRMGPVFREATNLQPKNVPIDVDDEEQKESAVNSTFSVSNSTCDSTFVVDETNSGGSSKAVDSTFSLGEGTSSSSETVKSSSSEEEQSPQKDEEETWRPPTPPKKMLKLSSGAAVAAAEKENISTAAPLEKVLNLQQSAKLALRPNNFST